MKNSNLLNRLLSYSHEKQSPQRFGRYAAMLIMLLTLGVGQMWAVNWNLTSSERLYIDCTNWDGDNAKIKLSVYGTNEQFWKDVYPTHLKDHIYYWDVDGDCRGFKVTRLSSDGKSSWNWTGVAWAKDRSNNDEYLMTLGSCSNDGTPTWSYGPYSMSSGYTFYFNNSVMQVATPNLRIGRTNYCTATGMSLENGTRYLYSCSTSNWQGYEAITVADKASYTGSGHSIYGKGGDIYLVTKTTNHHKASVSTNIYANATGTSGTSDGVTYYTTSYSTSLPTYSASISSTSNGTLAVYKYTSNNYETNKNSLTNFSQISNGATGLLPTQILKIVTTPYSNCELISLSVSGATKIEDVTGGSTYYVTGNVTISATFGTLYSVSITKNDASMGSVSTSSVLAGSTTHPSITATPNDGYYFVNWTSSTGSVSVASSTSATTTVTATATGTLTANFALRYAVVGSVYGTSVAGSGMPGWSDFTKTLEKQGTNNFRRTLTLEGNKKYKFRIKDLETGNILGGGSEYDISLNDPHTTFDKTGGDVTFTTQGSGNITFQIDGFENGYPQVRVLCDYSSWQITRGQKAVTDGCWTPVDSEGGTVTAVDGYGYSIASGQYVKNGGSVTFTAEPAEGFVFDGWYNSAELSGLLSTDAVYTMSSITSARTVYAKFKEITFMVYVSDNNNSRFEKVGTKSHPEITAVSPSGQVFARWDVYGTATVADPYSKTTTITGASDNSGDVIARFQDPPTLYYVIDKIPAGTWTPTEMYIYFYENNYWDEKKGSGSKSGCLTHAGRAMTAVEGKNNRWWKYTFNPETDPDLAGHTIQTVSFMSKSQENYDNFNNSNTGTHRIYQSCMNMFIVTKSSGQGLNDCWYYNDGYWYNYQGTKSGYYLHGLPGDEEELIADEAGNYSASVNLEANHDYYFYIGGCDGKNWANEETYKGNSHKHQVGIYGSVDGDGNRIKLTTNVGGLYTFTLTPIYNTVDEYAHMDLDITYPILANDYRAVNTTPTKDLPSNVISGSSDGDTISLWLQQGNNVLAFKEAAVNGSTGALTWSGSTTQTVNVAKNGVYKMKLSKTGVSTFEVSDPEEYTGKFYIRTDCAPGKWKEYKQNSMTNNTLTFNTEDATTYDYYYCKWIKDAGSNVRFVVANEWNMAISDTLIHDAALGNGSEETLPQPASVRFSYNSYTNDVKRAYLSGSTNPNDRFLILHGNKEGGDNKVLTETGETINYHETYSNLNENEAYFEDKENRVYQVNLKAKSGAEVYLTAKYNGSDRDLYGSSSDLKPVLTSNNGSNSYPITAIYDFKTNNMMIAWHPGSGAVEDQLSGLSSVMIVRDHQQAADQITFNGGSIEGSRVYGVMRFNKWTLNNQERTSGHAQVYPLKSVYERALYWVSFPFNVRLKEVFGMGTYGIHWIMEYYDGAGRAERGWWVDSEANWKFYYTDSLQNGGPDGKGTILQANVGYVLGLDLDYFYTYNPDLWGDGTKADDAYLYFPSMRDDIVIDATLPTSVTVPAHQCTIDRRIDKSVANTDLDRRVVDSHWNVIGVPSYSNVEHLDSVSTISDGENYVAYPEGFGFYYAWNMETNRLDVTAKSTETIFKTMHGYMLQFAGTINWQTRKASLVAARTKQRSDQNLRLEILNGETKQDHTLLRITEEEGVTMRYDLNQDLCKETYADQANIWTLTDDTIPVAGNSLPYNEEVTIIPVGVQIAADGEYTFSMPEGTNGVGVILVDKEMNARTSLSLTDYTVNLTEGTYDERFELELSPIVQMPTDLENGADGETNKHIRKVMVDGVLYIVKDGKIFDARGNRVQ